MSRIINDDFEPLLERAGAGGVETLENELGPRRCDGVALLDEGAMTLRMLIYLIALINYRRQESF